MTVGVFPILLIESHPHRSVVMVIADLCSATTLERPIKCAPNLTQWDVNIVSWGTNYRFLKTILKPIINLISLHRTYYCTMQVSLCKAYCNVNTRIAVSTPI